MVTDQSLNISYKVCRRISGVLFALADIVLLGSNFHELNYYFLFASILFLTGGIAIYLSSYNHRWFFYNAIATIIAYLLVSFFNQGDGLYLQILGGSIGIIGGLLIFRAALQREFNKQYNIPKFFKFIDNYPLASADILEGTSAIIFCIGSIISKDIVLIIVSGLWISAHIFMFYSDEYLQKRLGY